MWVIHDFRRRENYVRIDTVFTSSSPFNSDQVSPCESFVQMNVWTLQSYVRFFCSRVPAVGVRGGAARRLASRRVRPRAVRHWQSLLPPAGRMAAAAAVLMLLIPSCLLTPAEAGRSHLSATAQHPYRSVYGMVSYGKCVSCVNECWHIFFQSVVWCRTLTYTNCFRL